MDTNTYTLTVTYKDGMVAKFDYTKEQMLFEMAQRIMAAEAHANVKSWVIEPRRNNR